MHNLSKPHSKIECQWYYKVWYPQKKSSELMFQTLSLYLISSIWQKLAIGISFYNTSPLQSIKLVFKRMRTYNGKILKKKSLSLSPSLFSYDTWLIIFCLSYFIGFIHVSQVQSTTTIMLAFTDVLIVTQSTASGFNLGGRI